jgi:alkylresorcinol/alkylpyrone synthase
MLPIPRLAALATAVPAYALEQEAIAGRVSRLFAGAPQLDRLLSVFANSGIRRRYSAVPIDWFDQPHRWPDRNRCYLDSAVELLDTVAGRVLDRAGVPSTEIGGIVVVSTTGIATPSLDALLIERLRLPRNVQRLPIFGLGCNGGAVGLARAATMAAAMPAKAVLFLVVELCSLSFRRDNPSKSDIVASALFGDGAAGALLCCGGDGPAVAAAGEHTWPDSLSVMGWDVVEDGLKPIFSRDIPRLVAAELGPVARDFLRRNGLVLADIDRFACHPGGPKVIDACEEAYLLPPGTLDAERTVLRDFGNMSAASVLFVLDRLLASAKEERWRHELITALGPGFTAGFVLLSNA